MPENFLEINRYFALTSYCNTIGQSSKAISILGISLAGKRRLQNSPYFCVFKYARAVKQKVWNEAENRERDWGETLKIRFFSLASHALRACEARALGARKTLTPRVIDFFTDFEEKNDFFAV